MPPNAADLRNKVRSVEEQLAGCKVSLKNSQEEHEKAMRFCVVMEARYDALKLTLSNLSLENKRLRVENSTLRMDVKEAKGMVVSVPFPQPPSRD